MHLSLSLSALALLALLCAGEPDVSRIDALSAPELASCDAWVRAPHSERLKQAWQEPCPFRAKTLTGAGPGKLESSFDEASGVLTVPQDAIEACGVIAGAIKLGALPADAAERHGLTMFDVGAAFAGETVVGAKLGFRVAAFEARQDEFERIVAATRHFRSVDVVHAAATARHGPVTFHMADDSSSLLAKAVAGGAEAAKARRERVKVATVPGVTLDDYAAQHSSRVGVIKIDVQGAEYEVLAGARGILGADAPVLYFEYDRRFAGPKVLCLARALGYECALKRNMVLCLKPE